jgi:ferric-dicitrate binding protein FerR (iron transport regulator)
MKPPDRKETEVRGLLESVPPASVPPDLAERAVLRGLRVAHRRRTAALLLWAFFAAAVAFAVWAAVAEPWVGEPVQTTPPLGW